MADFNKPATTDTYANILSYINAKFSDLALGLDPANTTPTNLPTNTIRWNSANNQFEKYNGTTWAALSSAWTFGSLTASGTVTLSGGTANGVPYLNASKVLTSGSVLAFDGTTLSANGLNITGQAQINSGNSFILKNSDNTNNFYLYNAGATGSASAQLLFMHSSLGEVGRFNNLGWLGIGKSPAAKFEVKVGAGFGCIRHDIGGSSGSTIRFIDSDNNTEKAYIVNNGGSNEFLQFNARASNGTLVFLTADTERIRIDNIGNAGFGVTPSAWNSTDKAIQIGSYAAIAQDSSGYTALSSNAYESAAGTWKYLATLAASRYSQEGGAHKWLIAASGTAGTTISFTQAMTLNLSGDLALGLASPSYRFHVRRDSSTWEVAGIENQTANAGALLRFLHANSPTLGYDMGALGGTDAFVFRRNATEILRFDANGNAGLNCTPNAWGSPYRGIEFAYSGGVFGGFNSSGICVVNNTYYNGTNWLYIANGGATRYVQIAGSHVWQYAASGTAGTSAAFTNGFQMYATGGVTVGNTTDPGANNLSVVGSITAGSGNVMLVQSTSKVTTSGTNIDFTSLPSWVKRITVMFQDVSTNGSANIIVQLGTSGGFQTSSYKGGISSGNNAIVTSAMSSGFDCAVTNGATATMQGQIIITNHNGNVWVMSGITHHSETTTFCFSAGSVSLSGALTQLRLTTVGGTNTFDNGAVNIIYE